MQEWREGWWGAERSDALRQAEEVCEAPDAWHPSALVWETPDDDVMAASSHECVPCLVAVAALRSCLSLSCPHAVSSSARMI